MKGWIYFYLFGKSIKLIQIGAIRVHPGSLNQILETGETSIVQNQLPAVRGLERWWEGAFNGEMAVVIIPEGISHGSFGLKVSFFGYTCDFQD